MHLIPAVNTGLKYLKFHWEFISLNFVMLELLGWVGSTVILIILVLDECQFHKHKCVSCNLIIYEKLEDIAHVIGTYKSKIVRILLPLTLHYHCLSDIKDRGWEREGNVYHKLCWIKSHFYSQYHHWRHSTQLDQQQWRNSHGFSYHWRRQTLPGKAISKSDHNKGSIRNMQSK